MTNRGDTNKTIMHFHKKRKASELSWWLNSIKWFKTGFHLKVLNKNHRKMTLKTYLIVYY
jgi:hypothetical protein